MRQIKRNRIGDATLNTTDPTYSASDIVGKTLIAKGKVIAYDEPYDNANVLATFSPGQTIGVVTSWESPDAASGRKQFYWQFVASNGSFFYVPHFTGEFDIQALADQGALNAAQQTQAALDANKSLLQQEIEKYVPWVIGGVIGVMVLGVVLKRAL